MYPISQLNTEAVFGNNQQSIPTGFAMLDEATSGFLPGELVIIGGCSSMGKSSFMVDLIKNISTEVGVLVFSIEMGAALLIRRLICSIKQINYHKLMQKVSYDSDTLNQVRQAQNDIKKNRAIFIGETNIIAPEWYCQFKPDELFMNIEIRQAADMAVRVVFIDYLQLIDWPVKVAREDLRLHAITRELKMLANELGITIVLLDQLRKEVAHRKDPTPMLNDLRDAGQVINNADKIFLLHRPDYYEKDREITDNCEAENAQIIIAKQRNGPTGTIYVKFLPYCMSFVEQENF